uniref:Uncharacterized protein n=1 Tax=Serinus canaria TaxID=9135 RepID=A0A8C9UHX2_SERCA
MPLYPGVPQGASLLPRIPHQPPPACPSWGWVLGRWHGRCPAYHAVFSLENLIPGTRPIRRTTMRRRLLPVRTLTALLIVMFSRLTLFTSVILSPTQSPACSTGDTWLIWAPDLVLMPLFDIPSLNVSSTCSEPLGNRGRGA